MARAWLNCKDKKGDWFAPGTSGCRLQTCRPPPRLRYLVCSPFTSPSALASHPLCTQLLTCPRHTLRSLSGPASSFSGLAVRAKRRSGRQKWDIWTGGPSVTQPGMVSGRDEVGGIMGCGLRNLLRAVSCEGWAFVCLDQCLPRAQRTVSAY